MLRTLAIALVCVSAASFAQRGPRTPTPAALPEMTYEGSGSHGPDGNASGTGVLRKPFCFKKPEFCAAPGMKLTLWTQYGELVALQAIESPKPFTLIGVRFAANTRVTLGPTGNVSGTLEAPMELDGRLVKGQVELVFDAQKVLHAQVGTLAREAVIEGWSAPAGYVFDLRNLSSGSMVLTGPAGAPPATRVDESWPGVPAKARVITQWRDAQGAGNLQLELTTAEALHGLTFGPGPVTFLRSGELRATRGVVSAPFERGAVKAPKGSFVVLCGNELQTVKTDEISVRVGRFVTSKLDAVRERTPPGWRNDVYGQQVLDECGEGALLGYRFLPQYCPCGGRVPSLVNVDQAGEPKDDESRAMLDTFPSLKKTSCPPCR